MGDQSAITKHSSANPPQATCPMLDFDHRAVGFAQRFAIWDGLRAMGPIVWTDAYGGHWAVAGHKEASEVLRDPETWSSARTADGQGGQSIPPFLWPRPNVPGEYDGEEHARLRRAFTGQLDPKVIRQRKGEIEAIVKAVFDAIEGQQEIDAAQDIAILIPGRTILTVIGLDPVDALWMGTTAQALLANRTGSARQDELQVELRKIEQRMLDQVAERRANPRDDIVSAVATMRGPDGGDLPRDDMLSLLVNSFLFGGLVTAAKVIAGTILLLGHDRALRRRLIDEPKLIPGFVNDFIRFTTPANSVGRTATRDTELGGQNIRKGDRVLVMLNAANFDPQAFPCPQQVDPKRTPNKHLAFGFGAHFCPGSPLARLEIELAIEELLRRMPDYALADPSIGENDLDGAGGWERLAIRPKG